MGEKVASGSKGLFVVFVPIRSCGPPQRRDSSAKRWLVARPRNSSRSNASDGSRGFQPTVCQSHFAVRGVATGRKSAAYIPFIKFDRMQLEQFAIFFLERFRAMMLALPLNVSNDRRQVRLAQRKMHRMRSPWFLTRRYATNLRWGAMDRGLKPTATIVSSLRNGRSRGTSLNTDWTLSRGL